MNTTENITRNTNLNLSPNSLWKIIVLLILLLSSLAFFLNLEPIMQSSQYHLFADSRQYTFIPNFFDVVTNIPFLLIGGYGFYYCRQSKQSSIGNTWMMMFLGIGLVSLGSAYYHWQPSYDALFWDRLPMTLAFMSLFVAILSEYLTERIVSLLLPTVIFGVGSVIYWYFSNDLRLYFWVQFAPLLTISIVMLLFKSRYSHQWLLLAALAFYLLAKVTEFYDVRVYQWTYETLSGHSIKHLLASASCYCILLMLKRRKIIGVTF